MMSRNLTGAARRASRTPGPPTRHPAWVLACVCAATAVVIGFVAAINLAVPLLAASALHPSASQLLWVVDSYVLVFACLVIPAGAVGDRFGRKAALVAGLLVFAAGAAISAASGDVALMLVGRVVTGLGAALVLPNGLGVLIHATPPERRRGALAIWAAATGIGGVLGNVGGGALMTGGSWRALFVVVAPVALACAAWAAVVAPRSPRGARPLDPAGTVLLVAAAVSLFAGIIEGPEYGWGSAFVLGALAAAVLLGAAWVIVELRVGHPMLDPRLFRSPLLAAASLGMLVAFFGNFGLFYLNASLLQYGRGFSVLEAGLGILPLSIPMLVGSRFVPLLVDRIGTRLALALAFLATGAGLAGLSFAARQPYPAYAAWLFVVGVGMTIALPCLTAEIAQGLPAEQAGVAGGLQSATRELGSALGVAVVGTVLTSAFARQLPAALQSLDPAPRTVAAALTAAPAQHAAIIGAFSAGTSDALRVAAVVVLVAAGFVVAAAKGRPRAG